MKTYISSFASAVMILFFFSCEKNDALKTFADGSAPFLTVSSTTVSPLPTDADNVVLTLNWTDPGHAQDKSLYKYYLEVDSADRNFSKATRIDITKDKDKRTYSFTGGELNDILLSYGFVFNVAYNIDLRVISSYGNNNEQLKSNIVKIKATPYKIPPKVELPSSNKLFIVGSATQGGWTNPVPVPSQELSRVNETTFGGIFQFNGGAEYLLLPVNGKWDTKYAINDNSLPGVDLGGDFFFSNGPGKNFKGPSTSGLYKITVDFQLGKYKLEPFTQQHGLPSNLFIIGGATPGGWVNPVPVPSQQLTRRNAVEWDITLNFSSGQDYLLLPTNGDWGRKFGVDNRSAPNVGLGGNIKPEGADIPAPASSGTYKFVVDFYRGVYTLTPQ